MNALCFKKHLNLCYLYNVQQKLFILKQVLRVVTDKEAHV